MKFGYQLFLFLFFFYALVTVVYWQMANEPVGITALALSAGLALIIGYYFWFSNRRTGGVLPEDNLTAEIADAPVNWDFSAHTHGGLFQLPLLQLQLDLVL